MHSMSTARRELSTTSFNRLLGVASRMGYLCDKSYGNNEQQRCHEEQHSYRCIDAYWRDASMSTKQEPFRPRQHRKHKRRNLKGPTRVLDAVPANACQN